MAGLSGLKVHGRMLEEPDRMRGKCDVGHKLLVSAMASFYEISVHVAHSQGEVNWTFTHTVWS